MCASPGWPWPSLGFQRGLPQVGLKMQELNLAQSLIEKLNRNKMRAEILRDMTAFTWSYRTVAAAAAVAAARTTAWRARARSVGRKLWVNISSRPCTNTEQSREQQETPKSTLVYYLTLPASPILAPHLPRSLPLTQTTAPLPRRPPPPPRPPRPLTPPGSLGRKWSPGLRPRSHLLFLLSPHLQRLPQVHAAPQGFSPRCQQTTIRRSLTRISAKSPTDRRARWRVPKTPAAPRTVVWPV